MTRFGKKKKNIRGNVLSVQLGITSLPLRAFGLCVAVVCQHETLCPLEVSRGGRAMCPGVWRQLCPLSFSEGRLEQKWKGCLIQNFLVFPFPLRCELYAGLFSQILLPRDKYRVEEWLSCLSRSTVASALGRELLPRPKNGPLSGPRTRLLHKARLTHCPQPDKGKGRCGFYQGTLQSPSKI